MSDEGQGRSRGLRLWHVLAGVIGLLVALIVLWMVVQHASVKRRIAALRAQGYPTSFAELAEQNRVPDGARNAADVYVQAFQAFCRPADKPNTPYLGSAQLPPRGDALPGAMVAAIEQLLVDNAECLNLLREASAIEHCHYDWDYTGDMPYLASMRRCAQLLAAVMVLHADRGDEAAVMACFNDGLRLAASSQNGPGVSYLLSIATTALSLRAMEQSLSRASFTDEQLVEMARLVDEAAVTVDFTEAMINQRCALIELFRGTPEADGAFSMPRIPILGRFGLADALDYTAKLIEVSKLPLDQRFERIRKIEDEMADLSILHVSVKMVTPSKNRVAKLDVRFRMDLQLADCALAIERRRLVTGTTPESLADLVPDYLDQVPIDPFDGQPIRYLREGQGYCLYSVFEDGRDQGGQTRDEVNRGDPYDWAFVVVK